MYVLDTNAFYYAAGISECTYDVEKLQKLVDENEVFISSTSLFEFLIKFRNDIQTIHKGGKYLWEKKIKLAGNVINPLPNNFTGDIINLTESELQTLCSNILENKIDAESRFISILFDMCLFSGFYFSAMSDGVEPSGFCFEVFEKAFRMFANINLEVFVDIFTEGYKTDDCENYVRNCFYNLLAFELEKGIPFIERAKAVKDEDEIPDIDDWLSSEDYSHDTEKLSNKMKAKTSTAFLQRLAIKYWKSNNDPELKNHISKLKSIFDKKVKLTALQDYYYDTLVGIMTKGAALWKNDLLDAIILCNVQDLHVMITYDNGVIKRMEKRKSEYPKYLETKDYIINYQDLQGIGMTGKLALPTLIAMCSIALGKPTLSSLAVLGEISISGTMMKVDELANSLQVCLDSGAKRVLLPITSAAELGTVPADLIGSFNLIFYSSAEDAVFKALGVE